MSKAVLAMPIVDEQMPQFIDSDAVPLDATRWLFFPGDVLSPRRKRELKDMTGFGIYRPDGSPFGLYSNGGEEINSPCLVRTKGVLSRALLTPLDVAAVWTPPDLIPEGMSTFRGVLSDGGPGVHRTQWQVPLPGIKTFPGEVINVILTTAQNDQGNSKGVVEIQELRTVKWDEASAEGLQSLFFPTWPSLPPTLNGLIASIEGGRKKTGARDLRAMGDEMLSSCEQFRLWASERIKLEETLIAVGTTKDGWTYRFSDVADQLMVQLEITPQSRQLQEQNKLQAQFGQQVAEIVKQRDIPVTDTLMSLINAQRDVFADAFAAAIEKVLDKVTGPSAPTTPAEPPKAPNKK